jgi:hypothetical protein
MSRLRAYWVTHAAAGCGVTPRTWTRAAGHLQHEQHVQPLQKHGVDREEVHRQHALGLCPEELPPGQRRPLGRRFDAGPVEDGPYGAGPELVAQPGQLTVDATVAPGRVLPSQPHYQRPKLGRHSWATAAVRVAPAASDQILMPAQQRLGPDEQPVPAPTRQPPGESGQHGPVGPVHPRPGHLTPQHLDLVAQHEQLGILRGRTPRQQRKPPQCLAEQQVQQSQGHAAIMWPDGLPGRTRSSAPTIDFLAPTRRRGG